MMKFLGAVGLFLNLLPAPGSAASLNLATLTCGKYENEVLPAAASNPIADPINTVMWLFGYSVAKSGAHVMYADALSPFGFALDDECKSNPNENMLDALRIVKPETKSPMDLSAVPCSAFATRHVTTARTDPDSATTIMMWLFGFSVATSGSHVFDPDGLDVFEKSLLATCDKTPDAGLLEALSGGKKSVPGKASKPAKPAGAVTP